jgi:muramoyltetrapeptide carboxypeptidase
VHHGLDWVLPQPGPALHPGEAPAAAGSPPRPRRSKTLRVTFAPVPALLPGDPVAVVAPSGPFDEVLFLRGLERLAGRYRVRLGPHLREARRYLAGTDAQRGADLQGAWDEAGTRAVFAARGGYGLARLLPKVRFGPGRALVGFSDVTAGHLACQAVGLRSLHAPVVTQLGGQPPEVVARLFDALEGRPLAPLRGARTVVPGVAQGPLVGGNLMVLSSLVGTPFLPAFAGAVLLLEDVGERPYRLDRLFTQLRLAGVLRGLAGVVLGDFTDCEERAAGYTAAEVVDELVAELGVPCAAGFQVGHGPVNLPVPLGAQVRLDAGERRLDFLEGLAT